MCFIRCLVTVLLLMVKVVVTIASSLESLQEVFLEI